MARTNKVAESFDSRVEELYKSLSQCFGEIDELTAHTLKEFCIISAQIQDCEKKINKEGLLVQQETVTGIKKKVENPLIGIKHKLAADHTKYYSILKRGLAKKEVEDIDEDLRAFIGL